MPQRYARSKSSVFTKLTMNIEEEKTCLVILLALVDALTKWLKSLLQSDEEQQSQKEL